MRPRRPPAGETLAPAGANRKTRPPPERQPGAGPRTAPRLRHRAPGGEHAGQAARRTTPANGNGRRRHRNGNHPRRRHASGGGNGADTTATTSGGQPRAPRARETSGGGGRGKPANRHETRQGARRRAERNAQRGTGPGRERETSGTDDRRRKRQQRESSHGTPHEQPGKPRKGRGEKRTPLTPPKSLSGKNVTARPGDARGSSPAVSGRAGAFFPLSPTQPKKAV
jgi:hypothetical protein